jgi:hypothetical protein
MPSTSNNTNSTNNNLPFDSNFNITQSAPSTKQPETPTFNTFPTGTQTAVNNNPKLETDQLLKSNNIILITLLIVMYSDNTANRGVNVNVNNSAQNNFGNAFPFEGYGNTNNYNAYNNNPYNNMQFSNQQKPQANTASPFDLQFNNLNINSTASSNTWNNNQGNNWANSFGNNQGFNVGNNYQGGFNNNLGNKNTNTSTGFSFVNNSTPTQSKFNDVNYICKGIGRF